MDHLPRLSIYQRSHQSVLQEDDGLRAWQEPIFSYQPNRTIYQLFQFIFERFAKINALPPPLYYHRSPSSKTD